MAIYKVIGIGEDNKFQDDAAYFTAIGYIFSHARYTGGINLNSPQTAAQEMLEHTKACHMNYGKRLRHSVLSFYDQEGITAEMAARMAESIILHYSDKYQMVYAVHDDIYHLHIHFIMNQIGLDGTRYPGKKADYYKFKYWMQLATNRKVLLQ